MFKWSFFACDAACEGAICGAVLATSRVQSESCCAFYLTPPVFYLSLTHRLPAQIFLNILTHSHWSLDKVSQLAMCLYKP